MILDRLSRRATRLAETRYFGFEPPPYDGMQNRERMRFLFDSVRRFGERRSGIALEVGSYRGCSTVFLANACLHLGIDRIFAVDLFTGTPGWQRHTDTFDDMAARMRRYGLDRAVEMIRSDSRTCDWHHEIDVLHLDADHSYEAVTADAAKYVPHLAERGLVVFDDYDRTHPGVQRAVHELLASRGDLEIVAVHGGLDSYGSICLKRFVA
jgi:predicted O-methyltransferase YrrM